MATAFATRIDPRTGVRETAGFIPTRGVHRIFSCLHRPPGRPVGALVVCPSILSELLANYSNEVTLARMLARRGIAVRRFQYRGSGHSDGEPAHQTLDSMRADAETVADRLADESGLQTVGSLGTRFGAFVAASVAERRPRAPLVLWEPFPDGVRFMRELHRMLAVLGAKGSSAERTEDLVARIIRDGHVDVGGYAFHRSLYESAVGVVMADLLPDAARPILLLQLGTRPALRPEYRRLVAQWTEAQGRVEVQFIDEKISWWFHKTRMETAERLAVATVAWLTALQEMSTV